MKKFETAKWYRYYIGACTREYRKRNLNEEAKEIGEIDKPYGEHYDLYKKMPNETSGGRLFSFTILGSP